MKHTKLKLELKEKSFFVFIPALIWAGIIAFMSLLPSDDLPKEIFIISDKIIHAIIYFVLALLFFVGFIYRSNILDKSEGVFRLFLFSAFVSLAFGVFIEVAQENMNLGRSGDCKDVVADLFGIIIVYPFVKALRNTEIFKRVFIDKQG